MRSESPSKRKAPKGRGEKTSLHPLSPEDALRGFMEVDPEAVKEAERHEERAKRRRKKRKAKQVTGQDEENNNG